MLFFLLIGVVVSGISYLIAIARHAQTWKYILKPGTMVFIIAIGAMKANEAGLYGWLILLGLLFSVAGDIFLMLPGDRFVSGLIAFFCAHLIYVIAFPGEWVLSGVSIWIALLLMVAVIMYFMLVRREVRQEGGVGLQVAVLLYIGIISWMVFKAYLSGEWILLAGALFFYLSDAILGWNRFKKQYVWGEYAVMITYYTAQTLFALSVWTI